MTTLPVPAEPIVTARFSLLPLERGHAEEMAVVLADPELYVFTGGAPPAAGDLRARYERWAAGSGDPDVSWCNWAIRLHDPGCLAGWVQATLATTGEPAIRQPSPGEMAAAGPSAEIAWVVGVPWQGQGIATEAARALIAWLRRRSVRTVIAHIHPDHAASAAVAAAAGLTPTGHLDDGEVRWQNGTSPAAGR
jgi:RimJ/RimL family protein N-acetyltransferase